MKVAALSPHFMVESPTSAETAEASRSASQLKLYVVRPTSAKEGTDRDARSGSQGENQESLNQETREGLKRLSRLIQQKQKEQGHSSPHRDQKSRSVEPGLENPPASSTDVQAPTVRPVTLNRDAVIAALLAGERRRKAAFQTYRMIQAATDPLDGVGVAMDRYL